MKIAEIAKIIEAVLFVSGDGVDRDEFKRIYDLSDKELNKCIDILKERYNENTGVNIISYKNKLQLCSNPELADAVAEILNPIRERSLTKSALETIAIIAYKQPITRTEIEQIRGVNCDYAIQLLQSNNLIEVVGRKDAVGKPLLFGTTENFLKRFELENLEALPNYKELLDRIRVIHSEGDSLYREFGIPDEQEETNDAVEDNTETITPTTTESNKKAKNSDEQPSESVEKAEAENGENSQAEKPQPKQSKKAKKVQNEIKVEESKVEPSVETTQPSIEEDKTDEKIEKPQTKKSKSSVTTIEIANNQDVTSSEEKAIKTPIKAKQKESKQEEIITPKNVSKPEVMEEKSVELKKDKATKVEVVEEKPEVSKRAKSSKIENVEVKQEEQSADEQPKLSWRDKMRAKMEANSHHYENLHDYMENKKE